MEDITTIIIKLVLVVLLVLMNGFFVAAEFAVVKVRGSRLEALINEGNNRAAYAKKLTDHLDVSLLLLSWASPWLPWALAGWASLLSAMCWSRYLYTLAWRGRWPPPFPLPLPLA